jgi:hypothetical protein
MSVSWLDPGAARRRARFRLAAAGLAASGLLAGCTQTEASGAAASSPAAGAATAHAENDASRDWRNATYTMTCDGIVPRGFSAALVNGAARVPADAGETPYYDYFDVRYETAAHGDIDGDGAPDTVVLLQCSPQPSNGTLEEVQVFSADHGRLGTLPSPTTLPEAVMLAPLYDPAGLSVDHGDIVAGMKVYGPHDSHASGPSEHVTVRWHWDGQSFVRVP